MTDKECITYYEHVKKDISFFEQKVSEFAHDTNLCIYYNKCLAHAKELLNNMSLEEANIIWTPNV